MMKSKVTAEEFGKLPKEKQSEYKLQDGGFYLLDVESVDGFALEDVSGLRKALETERANARTFKAKAEAFGDADPAKVKADLAELEKLRTSGNDDAKTTSRIKQLEAQLTEKFEKQLTDEKTLSKALLDQLEEALVVSVATQAISSAKGSTKLLLPEVRRNVKMVKGPDGKYVAKVIDPKTGVERITQKQNASGDMPIDEFVLSLKNDQEYARAFDGSGASGTGAGGSGNRGGNGGGGRIDPNLPPAERLRLAHEAGATK